MSSTQGGWFQDPHNPTQQRYWDGTRWTDHVSGPVGHGAPAQSGAATTSLVLGVLSLLCLGALTGIPAMLAGRRATREIDASGGRLGGRGLATAGFVTGLLGTIITTIAFLTVLVVFAFGNSLATTFEETCSTVTSEPTTTECE